MTQYFFDISGVIGYLGHASHFTGIQRVAVTLADAACRQLPPAKAHLSWYDADRGAYVTIPYEMLANGRLTDPDLMRAAFGIAPPETRAAMPRLAKYQERPARAAFHAARHRLYRLLGRRKYQIPPSSRPRPPAAPQIPFGARTLFDELAQPGDHLVIMDAVWGLTHALDAFAAQQRRGVLVHTMLHDLIPIVMPEVMNDEVMATFEPWLRRSTDYTSSYLTVSHSTGRDLRDFLAQHGIDRPVRVTPLAQAALPAAAHRSVDRSAPPALPRPGLATQRVRVLKTHPYVLCVGTREIRKNVWRLAQAWERLRTLEASGALDLPRLVFAGQDGWMAEDFERMMAAARHLSGWIEIIDKPSDAELEHLYKHCLFTVTVSLYEGWGLPIGESLAYGKTAVVSKASSMPEVGGDLVTYCDPRSIDSICQSCRHLIETPDDRIALEAKIRASTLRQWDDVAADLLNALAAET